MQQEALFATGYEDWAFAGTGDYMAPMIGSGPEGGGIMAGHTIEATPLDDPSRPSGAIDTDLWEGKSNSRVATLQKRLQIVLGPDVWKNKPISGRFDFETKRAVRQFQSRMPTLSVLGWVDGDTWKALNDMAYRVLQGTRQPFSLPAGPAQLASGAMPVDKPVPENSASVPSEDWGTWLYNTLVPGTSVITSAADAAISAARYAAGMTGTPSAKPASKPAGRTSAGAPYASYATLGRPAPIVPRPGTPAPGAAVPGMSKLLLGLAFVLTLYYIFKNR